jgi:hypothetical protein
MSLLLLGFTASSAQALAGPTAIHASSNINPSLVGQSVTFRAQVHVLSETPPAPFGAIQFFDGVTPLGPPQPATPDAINVDHSTVFYSTSSLSPGDHVITAAYLGGSDLPSVSEPFIQKVTGRPTSTAVTSSVNPSVHGQNVTFGADVTAGSGGAPAGTVQFQIDGTDFGGPQTLDGSGHASVSTSSLSVGNHTVTASYTSSEPSTFNSAGSLPGGQNVNPAATSTAVDSSSNPSVHGQNVTFTATVTTNAPGSGTPNGTVQFKVDGADLGGPQTLDGSGRASVSTSTLSTGNHPVTATYTSNDPSTLNSSGSLAGGQTVKPADTSTAVDSSNNPSQYDQSVKFTATVTTNAPGSGTPTGTVQFRIDGADAGTPQTLDASGKASYSTSSLAVGPHNVQAVYTSNSGDFNGSSGSVSQTVKKAQTTLVYNGATTEDYHDSTTVSATLTRKDDSRPVAGKTVHFTLGSASCDGQTDVSGKASCTIVPQDAAGDYPITASFAGDGNYEASSDSKTFTIKREETTLSYTGDTVILNGGTAHASGVLREDGSAPIAGRSVKFTIGGSGGQSCTGTTDSTGTARCDITGVSQPLGPGTIKAEFAQDAYYLSSSASASLIVFAFPSRGAFNLGDRNATVGNKVTFWSAQWAQANSLSGGPAPSAYKGFASTPTPTAPRCGGTFTTAPGDSSNPPATVPTFMGTLVSTKVTQSGSTIRGDIQRIVVVKTDPGYGPAPGKIGTGTVVATYC